MIQKTRAAMNAVVVTKVKHLIGTIVVLFVMFGLITLQVRSLTEANRANDVRDAALANYQVQIDLYSSQVVQRENCTAGVAIREVYRGRLIGIIDVLEQLADAVAVDRPDDDPHVANLRAVVEAQREDLAVNLPPRRLEDCPPVPERPVFDPELQAADLDVDLPLAP